MDCIDYDRRNVNVNLNENIDSILNALMEIQLVFHNKQTHLTRKGLLKYNDLIVFYNNVFKIISRCRDFKSIYFTFLLMLHFTRLFFLIPSNKTHIFTHGDLRKRSHTDFNANPEIRNFGFQKNRNEIFIHDFGSSQTKSKIIFKDIVKIFNRYPEPCLVSDIIKNYFLKINEVLNYDQKVLNRILEASVILVFFAEFSAAADKNLFKSKEIDQLYRKVKARNFEII